MLGEAIEVVQQRLPFGGVDFDGVGVYGLPMRAENEDRAGFDALRYFAADRLEAGVCRVGGIVHCVGAAVGDEVDGGACHG